MRLSAIKLSGFKSFVDTTTIDLDSNLIGVVGPNGCGKSNVIDAVKWVLGESSAKNLRSDSMSDVIFNGSESRKAIGTASVELIFDNFDQKISGPYASYNEVSIRRVVSRDGISNYFLNNANCRRKDVTNLLLGTGLGSSGYSIIEQGMISRIVEAKPEDLRGFIEEAAGVTKFKDRRKDTLNRLSHTKENLERVNDIAVEVTKQLEKLTRQARNAERYTVLKEEQRKLNAEVICMKADDLALSRAKISSATTEHRSHLNQLDTNKLAMKNSLNALKVSQDSEQDDFDNLQKDYYESSNHISNKENAISLHNQNLTNFKNEIEVLNQELIETENLLKGDENILTNQSGLNINLSPELESCKLALVEADTNLLLYKEELENINNSIETDRDQVRLLREEDVKYETEIEQLQNEQDRLKQAMTSVKESMVSHRDTIESLQSSNLDESIATTEQELNDLKRMLAHEENLLATLSDGLDSNMLSLSTTQEEIANLQGQITTTDELKDQALNKASNDTALESLNLKDNDRLSSKIKVREGWEKAIDLVLLDKVNAFEVDDLDRILDSNVLSKMNGITFCKSNREQKSFNADQLHYYLDTDLIFNDLIAIYVANNLNDALNFVSQLNNGESVITKEGVWLSKEFIRVASKDHASLGYLALNNKITELNQRVAKLKITQSELQEQSKSTDRKIKEKKDNLNKLREKINENAEKLYAESSKRDILQSQHSYLADQLSKLDSDEANLLSSIDSIHNSLIDKSNAKELIASKLLGHENHMKELKENRMNTLNRIEELSIDISVTNKRIHEIEMEIGQSNILTTSTQTGIERLVEQKVYLLKAINEKNLSVVNIENKININSNDLNELLSSYKDLDNKLKTSKDRLNNSHEEILQIDNQLVGVETEINEYRIKAEELNLDNKELEVMLNNYLQDLGEFGLKIESVRTNISSEANIKDWEDNLQMLSRKISNLGAINLAAIDEKNQEEDRKNYLDQQLEDLNNAIQVLETAIAKIDNDTKERFRETFDGANKALKEFFPLLFGGGQAYLELDSDDLLTTGINIMASPPGKKIHNISMLSGGEKALTAIAFIFSMFRLNPSPFCLLDEVDAPLDESNIARFGDLVKTMSEQVQFLLVTHNKTTMSILDRLMGVTMGEPGVSRLVSVNLSDAVDMIDA